MVPAAPIVTVLLNPVELSPDTSKPVGAVAVIPVVISTPDTLNVEVADAVP